MKRKDVDELVSKLVNYENYITDGSIFTDDATRPDLKCCSENTPDLISFVKKCFTALNLGDEDVLIMDMSYNRSRNFFGGKQFEEDKTVKYTGHTKIDVLLTCVFTGLSGSYLSLTINHFYCCKKNKGQKDWYLVPVILISNGGHRFEFYRKLLGDNPVQWLVGGKSPFNLDNPSLNLLELQEEIELLIESDPENKKLFCIKTAFSQLETIIGKKEDKQLINEGTFDSLTKTQMQDYARIDPNCVELSKMIDFIYNEKSHIVSLRANTNNGLHPRIEKIKYSQSNNSAPTTPSSTYKLKSIIDLDVYDKHQTNLGNIIKKIQSGTLKDEGDETNSDYIKEVKKFYKNIQDEWGTGQHSEHEGKFLSQTELYSCVKAGNEDILTEESLVSRLNKPNHAETVRKQKELNHKLSPSKRQKLKNALTRYFESPKFREKMVLKAAKTQISIRLQVKEHLFKTKEEWCVDKQDLKHLKKDRTSPESEAILKKAVQRCEVLISYFSSENIGLSTQEARVVGRIMGKPSMSDAEILQYISGLWNSVSANYVPYYTGVYNDDTFNIQDFYTKINPPPTIKVGKTTKKDRSDEKNIKDRDPFTHFAKHTTAKDMAYFRNGTAAKANDSKDGILDKCAERIDVGRTDDRLIENFTNTLQPINDGVSCPFFDYGINGEMRFIVYNNQSGTFTDITKNRLVKYESAHKRAYDEEHPNVKSWTRFAELLEDNRGPKKQDDRNPIRKLVNEQSLRDCKDIRSLIEKHYELKDDLDSIEEQLNTILKVARDNTFKKYPSKYYDYFDKRAVMTYIDNNNFERESYLVEKGEISAEANEKEYIEKCVEQLKRNNADKNNIILPNNNE